MKKKIITLFLLAGSYLANAQVGLNCQYVPGLQFGSVSVKTNSARLGNYHYGAGLPLMMIDRVGSKWYVNLDMNALYYGATSMNKATADKIKIAKTEGGYFAGRVGRVFGKGETTRIGGAIDYGWSASNLDSSRKAFGPKGYSNFGACLMYYQKIGKIRFVGKVGYDALGAKKQTLKGKNIFFETTFAYMIYQKYGLSLMPCLYSKSFTYNYTYNVAGVSTTEAINAKVSSFVIRFGITKFL